MKGKVIRVERPEQELVDTQEQTEYHVGTKGKKGGMSVGALEPLLTLSEVCDLLKVPKSYIYWLTHAKKIPFIKLGGHLRFRESEIEAWLKSQEVR